MTQTLTATQETRANVVRVAVEALERFVANGGTVDQEWLDAGGPVQDGDSTTYVMNSLRTAALPPTRQ